jgi:phospholipid transport system substrate-binding protein
MNSSSFLAAAAAVFLFAAAWTTPAAAESPSAPPHSSDHVLLAANEAAGAEAPVLRLHDALLAAMKSAGTASFADRKRVLEPVIRDAFNLPAMTQVAAGPFWNRMSQQERDNVIAAFSDFSVSTYTARFNDFSGERFEVVGQKAGPEDSVWVLTRLVGGGEPVSLNYLVRPYDGAWRIVDVYLKGSISELANRRSEFTSTLRRSGVAGLLKALNDGSDRMGEDA